MELPIYQVDAFNGKLFGGNPAAVMPLAGWLADDLLQAIAAENNLSETAFLVGGEGNYELRWFTPAVEVDLCGHATLAAAHILYTELGETVSTLRFQTRSGELLVSPEGDRLSLSFPASRLIPAESDQAVCAALGRAPESVMMVQGGNGGALYIYRNESEVAELDPDFGSLGNAANYCVIATAPGDSVDFVSRFFGPSVGIDEDPVTGSAHCALTPYWAERLGRQQMQARQISARVGELEVELQGESVVMRGQGVTYMKGLAQVPG